MTKARTAREPRGEEREARVDVTAAVAAVAAMGRADREVVAVDGLVWREDDDGVGGTVVGHRRWGCREVDDVRMAWAGRAVDGG